MSNYRISNEAKEDLIRIYEYGVYKFGPNQAERYFEKLYEYFDKINQNPFSFESVDHIRKGYSRCPCDSNTIYYRVNLNEVEIMVIVGRQEYK